MSTIVTHRILWLVWAAWIEDPDGTQSRIRYARSEYGARLKALSDR